MKAHGLVSPATWLVTGAALMTLTGCAVGPPPMSHEGLLPLSGPVEAADMLPLEPVQAAGRLVTGAGEQNGITLSLQPAGDEPGVWLWRIAEASTSAVRADEAGARALLWETSTTDGVKVAYATPLVFLPASLSPGQVVTGESDVLVTKLSDGSTREQGTLSYQVTALGRQAATIGGRQVELTVVRETRRMKLRLAQSVVVVTTGYLPGVGAVVQTVDEKTTVLGLVPTHRRQRVERLDGLGG